MDFVNLRFYEMLAEIGFQIGRPIPNKPGFELEVLRAAPLRAPLCERTFGNAEKLGCFSRCE
jgi:hypothetical protein